MTRNSWVFLAIPANSGIASSVDIHACLNMEMHVQFRLVIPELDKQAMTRNSRSFLATPANSGIASSVDIHACLNMEMHMQFRLAIPELDKQAMTRNSWSFMPIPELLHLLIFMHVLTWRCICNSLWQFRNCKIMQYPGIPAHS
jgi:hypothetical protein